MPQSTRIDSAALVAETGRGPASLGDESRAAAEGHPEPVEIAFVPFTTPGSREVEGGFSDGGLIAGLDAETATAAQTVYLLPPEDMDAAYQVYRLSTYLSSVVDALCVNVYTAGLAMDSRIPLGRPETRKKIRAALELKETDGDFSEDVDISDEEVERTCERLSRRVEREALFLEGFFERCVTETGFLEMAWRTGLDLEVTGNAYWEVLRDVRGRPARFVWVPSATVRAQRQHPELVASRRLCMRSVLDWRWETQPRRFRTYIQLNPRTGTMVTRFKEYGDPRVLSRGTGYFYKDYESFWEAEREWYEDSKGNRKHNVPANEILHFRLPYMGSHAYGKPRWSPVYPGLVGDRELDEMNRKVVTDQEIPQMIMAISGGHPGAMKEAIKRFQEQIAQRKRKGERGIWIIHAYSKDTTPGVASQVPTVEWKETRTAQHSDALGLKFKDQVYGNLRTAYRVSRMSLGDESGVNRSTAMLSLRQTEEQVFDPRRDIIADVLNTWVLPELGIETVKIRFMSRPPRDPREVAEITKIFAEIGLTPDEAREIAGEIFNRDYQDLAGAWSRMPTRLLTAILQTKNHITAAAVLGAEENLREALREALREEFLEKTPGKPPLKETGEEEGKEEPG